MKSNWRPFYIFVFALFIGACTTTYTEPDEDGPGPSGAAVTSAKPARPFLKGYKNLVTQYHYAKVPEDITVEEKKLRFKALLVPPVIKVYDELNAEYQQVTQWMKIAEKRTRNARRARKKIAALKREYRATTNEELLAALKPHPPSIVLAQAALESAWGTSRFFVEARNVFGIWSFDENEPRIAAERQRGDQTIWLKKYKTIEDSVRDNYRVLARGSNYADFRKMRLVSNNPYELVSGLANYSEKGATYGEILTSMISYDHFTDFDDVKFQGAANQVSH